MKIDVFNNIIPRRFFDRLNEISSDYKHITHRPLNLPALFDLETRFKMMDQFGDYCQIISIASPPIEVMVGPEVTIELAKIANDGMAELVDRYPDRFPTFAAALP